MWEEFSLVWHDMGFYLNNKSVEFLFYYLWVSVYGRRVKYINLETFCSLHTGQQHHMAVT